MSEQGPPPAGDSRYSEDDASLLGTASNSRRRLKYTVSPLVLIGLLGFGVHVLLPQIGTMQQGLEALQSGRWLYLGVAITGSALVFVASAWMVHASVSPSPPWGRTIAVQVGAGFSSTVTPAGVGWFAVTQSFLQRAGTPHDKAQAATGLNLVLTVLAHIGLLLVLLPFLPTLDLPHVPAPSGRVVLDIAVVAAVLVGVVLWMPATRRRAAAAVVPVLQTVPRVLSDPWRSVQMVTAAIAQNLAYALCLLGSVYAFGASAPALGVLVVYLLAATVASLSPTPGGLGPMEMALVAGLSRLAIPGGEAVAAALTFRLFTFWLPMPLGALVLARSRRKGWI